MAATFPGAFPCPTPADRHQHHPGGGVGQPLERVDESLGDLLVVGYQRCVASDSDDDPAVVTGDGEAHRLVPRHRSPADDALNLAAGQIHRGRGAGHVGQRSQSSVGEQIHRRLVETATEAGDGLLEAERHGRFMAVLDAIHPPLGGGQHLLRVGTPLADTVANRLDVMQRHRVAGTDIAYSAGKNGVACQRPQDRHPPQCSRVEQQPVGERVALDAFPDLAFGRSDLGPQFIEKGLREEVANQDEAIPMESLPQRGIEQAPQEQATPAGHEPRKE